LADDGTAERVLVLRLDDDDGVRTGRDWTRIESPRVLRLTAGVVDTVFVFFPERIRFPLLARLARVADFSTAVVAVCVRAAHNPNSQRQDLEPESCNACTYCSSVSDLIPSHLSLLNASSPLVF
jgi:hypothetical protein